MTREDSPTLLIRPADTADRERLFAWANDPVTRANSFSPAPIAWDEHCRWFDAGHQGGRRWLYIVTLGDGTPVGQVRFDQGPNDAADISITIAPEWRGRGLASPAIRLGTDRLASDAGIHIVHAAVKASNDASQRAFLRAGYIAHGSCRQGGEDALLLRSAIISA